MMLAGMLIILACVEWVKSIYSLPPAPLLYTVIAVRGLIYAGVRSLPECEPRLTP